MPATGTESLTSSFAVGGCTAWYGPVCSICHRGYIGRHECRVSDLQEKIDFLQKQIDEIKANQTRERKPDYDLTRWNKPYDTSGCPCRPENGGSGICGCTLNSGIIC
jgi:hypothetical protein